MPDDLTPLDLTEVVLQVLGVSLVFGAAAVLCLRRSWRDVIRLPDAPEHDLDLVDLLAALAATLFLPGAMLLLFDTWGGVAPAEQPELSELELPAPREVLALACGQVAAGAALLYLGIVRIRGGLAGWGLRGQSVVKTTAMAVIATVAVWPFCAGLLVLTRIALLLVDPGFTPPEHRALETLHDAGVPLWIRGVTILGALVLAPVVEELFFRGLLQSALARWWRSPWAAIWASALAFGLCHYSVPDTIPTLTFFGLALGYAYARTRSLTLAIAIHAAFNAKNVLWVILSG